MPKKAAKGINPVQHSERSSGKAKKAAKGSKAKFSRAMKKESEELIGALPAPDAAPKGKLLYRPAEVARLLSISRSKCYALINSGVIPGVRLGKSVRVTAHQIEEFVRNMPNEHGVVQREADEGGR